MASVSTDASAAGVRLVEAFRSAHTGSVVVTARNVKVVNAKIVVITASASTRISAISATSTKQTTAKPTLDQRSDIVPNLTCSSWMPQAVSIETKLLDRSWT